MKILAKAVILILVICIHETSSEKIVEIPSLILKIVS